MNPRSGDADAQSRPAAPVRRLVIPTGERRDLPLAVVPALANHDHTVELLALRLVNGHDLHAGRVVDAAENLVLRQSDIESFSRARVVAVPCPDRGESRDDPPPAIERYQLVEVLGHSDQSLVP